MASVTNNLLSPYLNSPQAAMGLSSDTPVEHAGIYQCRNCGYETVVRKFECLPREKSCGEHGSAEPSESHGEVSWCLSTAVQEKGRSHEKDCKNSAQAPIEQQGACL